MTIKRFVVKIRIFRRKFLKGNQQEEILLGDFIK